MCFLIFSCNNNDKSNSNVNNINNNNNISSFLGSWAKASNTTPKFLSRRQLFRVIIVVITMAIGALGAAVRQLTKFQVKHRH